MFATHAATTSFGARPLAVPRSAREELARAVQAMTSFWLNQGWRMGARLGELRRMASELLPIAAEVSEHATREVEFIHTHLGSQALRGRQLSLLEHMDISDSLLRLHEGLRDWEAVAEWSGAAWFCFLTPGPDLDPLPEQAMAAGHRFEVFGNADDLLAALEGRFPDLVCLDLDQALDPGPQGVSLLDRLQAGRAPRLPVAFFSERSDLEARLRAVRAGGAAFFPRPWQASAVMEKLDQVAERKRQEPVRVLVVEDEQVSAGMSAAVLQSAGMEVLVASDPLQALPRLSEFRPDLVLMDLYMPGCSGAELAAVIRQKDSYVGLPIVYLSCEDNRADQLAALTQGAEDFLTKPIDPTHLLTIVKTRALRGRELRGLMERDRLTGLLNSASLKEQLRREVNRAARTGGVVSFAMIDLDHFKKVNDTHGHPAGDTVLVNLARHLQRRLRKTDLIGRYGGEEFAVVLPDTPQAVAEALISDLRRTWACTPQLVDGLRLDLSFSAGIASYPAFTHPGVLIRAADAALYEAKRAGRNRVVCRDPVLPALPASRLQ